VVINLFNFFRHYISPPFHSVIRIHLISLSYHILVNLVLIQFYGANVMLSSKRTLTYLCYQIMQVCTLNCMSFSNCFITSRPFQIVFLRISYVFSSIFDRPTNRLNSADVPLSNKQNFSID